MKQTQLIMGMPITIDVAEDMVTVGDLEEVFTYSRGVDEKFSTYKKTSEISRINDKTLTFEKASREVKEIFQLAEDTKADTNEYFNIQRNGFIDPSGIVKGWAILNASEILKKKGFNNFYIDSGGDIQVSGKKNMKLWRVGIRNPFNRFENVKILALTNCGVATSGTAIRGQHIYNPHKEGKIKDIVSLTVIGPNIYDADRFATAAFAMGKKGITFIENLRGFEGYMIDAKGIGTCTKGFGEYVA